MQVIIRLFIIQCCSIYRNLACEEIFSGRVRVRVVEKSINSTYMMRLLYSTRTYLLTVHIEYSRKELSRVVSSFFTI